MKTFLLKLNAFINSWIGTIVIVLAVIFFLVQPFVIPSGSMLNTMLIGDNLLVKKYSYGIPIPRIPWVEIPILPDFNGNGHLIAGNKPQRGDIVVFRYPSAPKIHYVKRNVAIGGDSVLYTKEGLWVAFGSDSSYKDSNAKTLEFGGKTFYYEPYAKNHLGVHYADSSLDAFEELKVLVANGQKIGMDLVQLGNGAVAFFAEIKEDEFFMMGDNRNNSSDSRFWGSVAYKYITGKPWLVYWSFDDDFNVRWERIGKSMEYLEQKALQEAQQETQKVES